MREVARVDRSQQESRDLMNALYVKLGEAVELAEQVQQSSQSKQELRQARKMAQQITRLRGDATELRHTLEDREET
jgi:hypothetical protein